MEQVVSTIAEPRALAMVPPFVVCGEQAILSGRPRGAELLGAVMDHLLAAPDRSVTPMDLAGVSFMDVSCADELLSKLLRRIRSGELGARYVYLQGANPSVEETIETVLHLRALAVLARQGEGVAVIGELKRPLREALEVLLEHKAITSSQLARALGKNTNIVCNRLNALQRMGLACRLREGSVAGGGRQYYYVSIL